MTLCHVLGYGRVGGDLDRWNAVSVFPMRDGEVATRAEGREVLRMRSEGLQAKEALCTQPVIRAEAWQAEFGLLSSARERKPEGRD